MTRQRKVLMAIISNFMLIFILVASLTQALGWSALASLTLLFTLTYPMVWLCWKAWKFWSQPIMQLTSYAQTLKDGQTTHCDIGNEQDLLTDLMRQIESLARSSQENDGFAQHIERLFSQMMQAWEQPVCLFDSNLSLLYANPAATEAMKQPLLRGTKAANLGFKWQKDALYHAAFQSNWQCQSTQYWDKGSTFTIFSATYIADIINEAELNSQKNLVRVLSHELRNSLTPMTSMTDTLLSAPELNQDQVRMVLERIQQRSNRLLEFVQRYAQLSQLPEPKLSSFEFLPLLDEVVTLLSAKSKISFHGESRCYADPVQLSQLLINLLKNAIEASPENSSVITVKLYVCGGQQHLQINDNGNGFTNLENIFTPFYTTKAKGSGIGLALCAEIARNHGGELKAWNAEEGGALVELRWPQASSI